MIEIEELLVALFNEAARLDLEQHYEHGTGEYEETAFLRQSRDKLTIWGIKLNPPLKA